MLVIVPAFNEAASLPFVLERVRAGGWQDICVIDDGSTDDTAGIASSHGAVVLRCPINLGIGGAVQTGYLWARERGYDAAVQIDGDGQHDPAFVAAVLEPILRGQADIVIGSRFRLGGGFRSTRLRRIGIRYLAWLLRLRCGARVSDPTSGFRATGRRAIELFARNYPSDYPEPEAIALARGAGLRLSEAPVRMEPRRHGVSSIDSVRTLYYLIKVSFAVLIAPGPRSSREGAARVA